jgi:Na+-translocating ferredoxin:NAD+ oxidoreductase RnfG subunit
MKGKIVKMAVGIGTILGIHAASAMTLLTQEQAMKEMFPNADRVVAQTRTPADAELAKIKARLGGTLVHFQRGSESASVQEKSEFTFYVGYLKNQPIGVALIEEQPGKWGPVTYIIMMDPSTAKVKNLAVMSYEEKRGRPIARRNFLDQFLGKGSADAFKVHKDIRAVSGATISSDATCFAVKKATVLCEELVGGPDKLAAVK